ncbi:MAG: FecR domain-containing protein [Myxococcota bacterium]
MTDWQQDLAKARERVRVEQAADAAGDLRRFRHTRRRRKQRNAGLAAAGAGALIALLVYVGAEPADSMDGYADSTELRDGSRMWVARDGRARVDQDDDEGTRIVLERGRARFEVEPRGTSVFEVASGDVRVRVLGTAFEVRALSTDQTRVSVEHGRVLVEGTTPEPRVLTASESTTVPTYAPRAAAVIVPEAIEPAVEEPAAPQARRRRRARRRTSESVEPEESVPAAESEVDARGVSPVTCDSFASAPLGSAADLMNAADVCRRAGQRSEAGQYLRRVLRDHRSDRRAALAAYTLGRVLLQSARFSDAAEAFANVDRYGPSRPLRESALVGQVEAHSRAGNDTRARALADQYLEWYPRGGRRDAVRRMAGMR